MRWVDFGYSQEGADLLNWGVLGESYEIDGGNRRFIVPGDELHKWALGDTGSPRFIDIQASLFRSPSSDDDRIDVWAAGSDYDLFLPRRITYTSAESDRISRLLNDIRLYSSETIRQILQGAKSMDGWDSYVATLKGLGVDEVTLIAQEAYDRYLKR